MLLLADYLWTHSILKQHITGMDNPAPDLLIQAVESFWQISSNSYFKHLQNWILCDRCYWVFSDAWCWVCSFTTNLMLLGNIMTRHCKNNQMFYLMLGYMQVSEIQVAWKIHTNMIRKCGGKNRNWTNRTDPMVMKQKSQSNIKYTSALWVS